MTGRPGHSGDFYVYPYGEERDRSSWDGKYAHMLEPWSQTEDFVFRTFLNRLYRARLRIEKLDAETGRDRSSWDGKYAHMLEPWSQTEDFVFRTFLNRLYRARLRIEKLDAETGEQILHDEAVFALYKADRNEEKDGDGAVKRYETETVIQGSRPFLEAMGARGIMPFARIPGMEADRNEEKDGDGAVKRYETETVIQGSRPFLEAMGARGIMPFARIPGMEAYDGNADTETSGRIPGPGGLFYGAVPAGTPVCREEDCIIFRDQSGVRTGDFLALSSVYDGDEGEPLQITGSGTSPE